MTEAVPALRPTLLLRLQFIECLLDHYGTVNRGVIMDYFGLSMPQASRDIHMYLDLAPGNASYDLSARAYRRSESFYRLWPEAQS
jgi:hypothetical protein